METDILFTFQRARQNLVRLAKVLWSHPAKQSNVTEWLGHSDSIKFLSSFITQYMLYQSTLKDLAQAAFTEKNIN